MEEAPDPFDIHKSPGFDAFVGEILDRLFNSRTAALESLDAPAEAGVYVIYVEPEKVENEALRDVVNSHRPPQVLWYVGEGKNISKRLKKHRAKIRKIIKAERKAAQRENREARVSEDAFAISFLVLAEPPPDHLEDDAAARSVRERRAIESGIWAACRPIANGLGFGSGRKKEEQSWTLLGPRPPKWAEEKLEGLAGMEAPVVEYPVTIGKFGEIADPRHPGTEGHGVYESNESLDDIAGRAARPGWADRESDESR